MSMIGTGRALLGPWAEYLEKVKGVEPSSLIGLWLQNEQSGSVSYDRSGQGNDGAYTGVTLGQAGVPGMGYTSPFFDGTNDYNDIYSAALNADFDGQEGTFVQWINVNDWEDGDNRGSLRFYVSASNEAKFQRSSTNNRLTYTYTAGGTSNAINANAKSDTGFVPCAMTWSKTGDKVISYYDGTQNGSTMTGLGTWAGNLATTLTVIGAGSTGPAIPWHGYIGPTALWKTPLTADQIAYLSKV